MSETASASSASQPQQPRKKRFRVLRIILVVLVVVAGGAWLTDSLIAVRAESAISAKLKDYSNLPVEPGVNAGGFPFVYEASRGKLSSLTVDASDLDVPGFGLASVHSSATNIEASTSDILHGRIENAPAQTISTTLQLDGLALGERLGITDLTIRRLANTAPNGGQESDAVFSGTIPDIPNEATVAVRLRIKADLISMTAYEVLEGPKSRDKDAPLVKEKDIPQDIKDHILEKFSLNLEGKFLPLRARPDFIYCEGGSIFLQSSQQNATINLSDLAPMAKAEPTEEEAQNENNKQADS